MRLSHLLIGAHFFGHGNLREHFQKKITVVFGCGGQRDKSKRKLMGKKPMRTSLSGLEQTQEWLEKNSELKTKKPNENIDQEKEVVVRTESYVDSTGAKKKRKIKI